MSLEDVAAKAGVSTATVSRVLNNIGVVRKSTRARVLKAVEELKYYPNANARALALTNSKTIGLIVSNLDNPFFLDIYRSLEKTAHDAGYEVLIASTSYSSDRLKMAVRVMLGRRVAGLAMVVSEMDSALMQELNDREVRSVVYDVGAAGPTIASIRTNYKRGMQRIAEYLYSLGHRRMAFIGHHTTLGPLSERRQAFVEIMEQYAPAVQFETVADTDGFAGGRQAVRELFSRGFNPTAILCVNDFMAVGVLRELRNMGLSVPGQVSVTGFDNIELSEVVHPCLTTVHVPREMIGKQIFDSLVSSAPGRDVVIEPELVVRDSTGSAALE